MAERGYRWYFRKGLIEVDHETGCWIWMGAQYDDGYGKIRGSTEIQRRTPMRAQRYFWHLYRGDPGKQDVSHNCHRRLCVRLRHLAAVTHAENMRLFFVDYPFGVTDREEAMRMMQSGDSLGAIADKLMAPRPAVMKLIKELSPDWRGSFDL